MKTEESWKGLWGYAKLVKTKSTEHGKKYEPIVLREYEKHMYKIAPSEGWKVRVFVTKHFFLGCSHDGKVVDSVCKDQFDLAMVAESVMVCRHKTRGAFKEYSSTKNRVFKANSKQVYIIFLNYVINFALCYYGVKIAAPDMKCILIKRQP